MNIYRFLVIALLATSILPIQTATSSGIEKQVIGWLEHIQLDKTTIRIDAKIDTGADTTSLNASNIKYFTKDHEYWIRFQLNDESGRQHTLERRVIRYATIKRQQATSLKRPVIMLGVCLNKNCHDVEVNLADRGNYKYQMLIGRNYLRDRYLIDSAQTFTRE